MTETWNALPEAHGLYDPRHESDACGTGFVADLHGPSRRVLPLALASLACMDHRGGVGADGQSGDGAGVLTQIPWAVLADALPDPALARPGELAVAMVFLPKDLDARDAVLAAIEAELARATLPLLAWRDVPTDNRALGEDALQSRPVIRQALLGPPAVWPDWADGPEPFERLLYIVRRRIERRVQREGLGPLHVASMSSRTVVYKGLLLSSDLSTFYPDLQDPRYETAIAVFHQRFSTNTFPTWSLAQPFRFLGHNGEINTLEGNRAWQAARAWAPEDAGWGPAWADIVGLLPADGSDSACLDTMVELLTLSGDGLLHAARTLVQPAFWGRATSEALTAFYRYHEARMEPWDGPAALVMTDGRIATACLDRNGLRPLRWARTATGLVVAASEAGIVRLDADQIVERGRLGPGGMLAVDVVTGRLLDDAAIHAELAARHPWAAWVSHQEPAAGDPWAVRPVDGDLVPFQKAMGYGREDVERVLQVMATTGQAPVGSMGDDTPLGVLSAQPQTIYRYLRQRFAQVTNPPIDPLREKGVMSLDTLVGARPRLLEGHGPTHLIRFRSPLLSGAQLAAVQERLPGVTLSTLLTRDDGLDDRLEALCGQALAAAQAGAELLVLSDHGTGPDHAALPMLLAVSGIHSRLVDAGLRHQVSLVCDSGEPIEDHHFACLIGFGADLVHPWLGWATAITLAGDDTAARHYRAAVEGGLRKILARMGVSCLQSYRGARLFEILGLSRALCRRWLPGPASRVGGAGADEPSRDLWALHAEAWGTDAALEEQGRYRWRQRGEHHALSPHAARALHQAVRTGDREAWQRYVDQVEGGAHGAHGAQGQPTTLRDMLVFKPGPRPIPLDEVEPAASIMRRFCTGAMSLGSLSREAHQALAVAMNRIGGKSNSGEGGEDPARFTPFADDQTAPGKAWAARRGDLANSAIKQVASARFGVTAAYLVAARELEIKMAQGSKPGEGGQIPGNKVTAEIASLRRSVPGVPLISPPPHHDVYSIEDLAQLIFDLKRVNDQAPVGVKLVARAGVGTIAAGVVKAGADVIQISGADGGTGASPLASIKYAGLPWEIGLAETQQVLIRNKLRGRVTLRVDGGLRTGRDVVLAALLGAEAYGFGTAALVAVGCVMARQCHLNTCPVGVATQDEALRGRFPGTPEHVIAFLAFVAEEVRHHLATLGFRTLGEAVGRLDRLRVRPEASRYGLDLSPLLVDQGGRQDPRTHQGPARNPVRRAGLDDEVAGVVQAALEAGLPVVASWRATNRDRSLGARAAGHVARRHGEKGLPDGTLRLSFTGAVGQSFGAFCVPGMALTLRGEAQDYVAKSMSGGLIRIRLDGDEPDPVLAGNTVLYGATGGALFVAGRVGERLAVRNSGALAVVEGCGDHGCEYMTGGEVVVLGPVGWNFGAGMSGGRAWILDRRGAARGRVNPGLVEAVEPSGADLARLHALVERHHHETGSAVAARLLADWEASAAAFVLVVPKEQREEARRTA